MELHTFTAPSIAEAYEQVRAALGEDALIISTQSSPRLGGTSRVEVVAAAPVASSPARPGLANDLAAHSLVRALAENAASEGDDLAEFVNPLAGAWRRGGAAPLGRMPADAPAVTLPDPTPSTEEPAPTDDALLAAIEERTRAIESTVQWLASRRANASVEDGPSALGDVHSRMVDRGVPPRLLIPLVQRLEGQLRRDASTTEVLRVVERALAALLPPAPAFDVDRAGQVVYVVGPRGSGKTSVALRLAREVGARRAIIAGTDIDRAGAPQQLLAAASAAGIEARLCYAPSELRALLKEHAQNVVIVDTPGQVGARDRMLELNAYAQIAPRRAVLLALPATIAAADALRATSTFAPLGLLGIVATRVDEGVGFGGIVAALLKSGVGLAYTTASEETTAGLAVGDNHALSLALLTGLWPRMRATQPEGVIRAGV